MRSPFWNRVDQGARAATPFGLTVLFLLISVAHTRIPELPQVSPLLTLICIFHWAAHRPELLPAIAVFLLGMLQDLLSGSALFGIYTLVFLLVWGALQTQRGYFTNKPFLVIWFGFVVVGGGAQLVVWLMVSLLELTVLSPLPFLFQFLITAAAFPPLSWLLMRWQQKILILNE